MLGRAMIGGVLLSCLCGLAAPGSAETRVSVCRKLANDLRANFATAPANAQHPLEALAGLPDAPIDLVHEPNWRPASAAALVARLRRDHAAPDELVRQVEALGNTVRLLEVPDAPVWIFDAVAGSLGCHRLVGAWVPTGAPAEPMSLPFGVAEGDLCQAEVMAGKVGGQSAVFAESVRQDGAYLDAAITVALFNGSDIADPCTIDVRYAMTLRAEHAFCREGVDCGAILRLAETFASASRDGIDPATMGGGFPPDTAAKLRADFDEAEHSADDTDDLITPPYSRHAGVALAFGEDVVVFPFRIRSGETYIARLGHGHRGATASPGYIFAAYGVSDGRVNPIAGVYIEAGLGAITGISVR